MCPEVLTPSQPIQILSDIFGWEPLVGFLRKVAEEDLRAFGMVLGRVLPLQVESHSEERAEVTAEQSRKCATSFRSAALVSMLLAEYCASPNRLNLNRWSDARACRCCRSLSVTKVWSDASGSTRAGFSVEVDPTL